MADAYLLDLTRSMTRVGRLATGIDRVERAYLKEMIARRGPVFGLVRSGYGYLLLDRTGIEAAEGLLTGGQDGLPDATLLSRLVRGRQRVVAQAETALRRIATGRTLRSGLAGLLERHLPQGFVYLNVGHSNLCNDTLQAVRTAQGRCHVLIHDTIPLDFPEFQRPGQAAKFAAALNVVRQEADVVICPSHAAAGRVRAVLGQKTNVMVAPIGVTPARPDPASLPGGCVPAGPYFVTVGTIEPRKNHAFLLDLWSQFGSAAPKLFICGVRGWNNAAVFDRLDNLSPGGAVIELNSLPDAGLAALVQGASGTLFPTLAEGFGLPPVEARMLGARVLCNDLPVLHENLGGAATFASVSRPDLWLDSIQKWEQGGAARNVGMGFEGPVWRDHFKTVLSQE